MAYRKRPYGDSGIAIRLALPLLLAAALLSGCRTSLLEGLDEAQANDLVVALTTAGIPAEKHGRMGRFSVNVDEQHFAAAWRVARGHGLPWQVDERPGLFARWRDGAAGSDDAAERRAGAIARQLRADPAVLDARVVLGSRGAAVSIMASAPEAVDRDAVEARVRAVASLGAHDPVALAVHPAPTLTVSGTEVSDPAELGIRAGVWLASAAVLSLLLGGVLWWRRGISGRPRRAGAAQRSI